MPITTVLAVVNVSDIGRAAAWYERVFGRPPDLTPMGSLAEWQITDSGWLQVYEDAGKAGSSYLTLGVDDLDEQLAALATRGVEAEEIPADAPMRLAQVKDPDGNVITFGIKLKGH